MYMVFNTVTVISLILGVVIPHVTALLSDTKLIPAVLGGYLTIVLSVLVGFLTDWIHNPSNFAWKVAVINSGVALLFAIITHFGVLKNTPVQAKLLLVGSSRPPSPHPSPGPRHEAKAA